MLDSDLAELYGIETFNLNKAVRRNLERFPEDFMFQLTKDETASLLRFQFGISKKGRGGRRYLPYVFTQEGVAMLSSVLNSPRAVEVNIAIMRTFVRLREMIVSNKLLASKLADLESRIEHQGKDIKSLFFAIHQLMNAPHLRLKRQSDSMRIKNVSLPVTLLRFPQPISSISGKKLVFRVQKLGENGNSR